MKQIAVKAQLREKKGKSWAKKLRVKKLIPCICYGPGKENMMLAVELSEIHRIIKTTKEVNIFIVEMLLCLFIILILVKN